MHGPNKSILSQSKRLQSKKHKNLEINHISPSKVNAKFESMIPKYAILNLDKTNPSNLIDHLLDSEKPPNQNGNFEKQDHLEKIEYQINSKALLASRIHNFSKEFECNNQFKDDNQKINKCIFRFHQKLNQNIIKNPEDNHQIFENKKEILKRTGRLLYVECKDCIESEELPSPDESFFVSNSSNTSMINDELQGTKINSIVYQSEIHKESNIIENKRTKLKQDEKNKNIDVKTHEKSKPNSKGSVKLIQLNLEHIMKSNSDNLSKEEPCKDLIPKKEEGKTIEDSQIKDKIKIKQPNRRITLKHINLIWPKEEEKNQFSPINNLSKQINNRYKGIKSGMNLSVSGPSSIQMNIKNTEILLKNIDSEIKYNNLGWQIK